MTTTWDLIGNEQPLAQLSTAASSGTPHHAYVLVGPEHLGKYTAARRFATALLCTDAKPPCGSCASCQLVEAGNHPDLLEIGRDDKASIEAVRELVGGLALAPHSGRFRVAIIPDAERLSIPAQNALLKTLEEPPPSAVLILTAAAPARLLPTTISRCRQVRFTVPAADSFATDLSPDAVSAAGRRPGLAVRLNDEPDELALRRSWGETFDRVLAADIPERLALAKELASEERITDILDEWIGLTRSALLPAGQAEPKTVTHLRKRYSQEQLSDHLHRLFAARRRLRYNPNVQLLIEQLLLRLA